MSSHRNATLTALFRGAYEVMRSSLLAPFDRRTRVSFLEEVRTYHGVYLRQPGLPRIAPEKLVRDDVPVQLTRYVRGKWELSLVDLAIVAGIVQARRSMNIFEIGTFDGRTALNIHLNAPWATIHTIDLPQGVESAPNGKSPGTLIRDLVKLGEIHQLWGDSLKFSPWYSTQDLVFVDADHSYRNCRADTHTALRMIEGREGVILWHDYGSWPGVTQAVDEMCSEIESDVTIGWIENTSLAVLQTASGKPLRLRNSTAIQKSST